MVGRAAASLPAHRRLPHAKSQAAIGVQGHSGRKSSTKLMWEGINEPLPEGNGEVDRPRCRTHRRTRCLGRSRGPDGRGAGAVRQRAGACPALWLHLLELHCAHVYLLVSFLSPLANRRTDGYGRSLDGRLRYPLEVFDAVRAVWPIDKPMSVRISATDWYVGGNDADDAVAITGAFAEHGVEAVDVSTGQVVKEEQPAYGRSYQMPYADRIRNEFVQAALPVATISVAAIVLRRCQQSRARRSGRPPRA